MCVSVYWENLTPPHRGFFLSFFLTSPPSIHLAIYLSVLFPAFVLHPLPISPARHFSPPLGQLSLTFALVCDHGNMTHTLPLLCALTNSLTCAWAHVHELASLHHACD